MLRSRSKPAQHEYIDTLQLSELSEDCEDRLMSCLAHLSKDSDTSARIQEQADLTGNSLPSHRLSSQSNMYDQLDCAQSHYYAHTC